MADVFGRWELRGVPADSLMIEASFIGYWVSRSPLPASTRDTSGILLRLLRRGAPDPGSYIPGPIPPADLKGMLEAVIAYYGPQTEVVGNELDGIAALTGSPAPSRTGTGPTVVLDSAGKSVWNQIPRAWLVDWIAATRIAAMCTDWRDAACKGFGLTSFLHLSSLPQRTATDTAYVTPMVRVLSVQDCYKAQSMGQMSEDLLQLVRAGARWHARPYSSGGDLHGTVICDPDWKAKR